MMITSAIKKIKTIILTLIIASLIFILYENHKFILKAFNDYSTNIKAKNYEEELKSVIKAEENPENKSNELIIDLFAKIANQENQIKKLTEKITSLEEKIEFKNNPENIDKSSLLLIELYKIKIIAEQNQEFGQKTNNIIPLAGEISSITKSLEEIAKINILASQEQILKNINQARTSNINPEEKQSLNKIINELITIKKVKNLDEESTEYKLIKIENFVKSNQIEQAYELLKNSKDIINEDLYQNLTKIVKFNQEFTKIINLILNYNK